MTIHTIANIVIGLALVGWILYRQLTWRIVSVSRMWRMPLILGGIGVVMLSQMKDVHRVSAVDLAVLVVELAVSLAIGALMGRIAVFRSRVPDADGAGTDGTETVLESRTGWLGLVLWIVMIGVRVGIDAAATNMGSVLASATGVILVMVAANRLARVVVFAGRVQKSAAVAA